MPASWKVMCVVASALLFGCARTPSSNDAGPASSAYAPASSAISTSARIADASNDTTPAASASSMASAAESSAGDAGSDARAEVTPEALCKHLLDLEVAARPAAAATRAAKSSRCITRASMWKKFKPPMYACIAACGPASVAFDDARRCQRECLLELSRSGAVTLPGAIAAITETKLDVNGKLSADLIGRLLLAHQQPLRACYLEGVKKHPDLQGTLTFSFEIDADGESQNVTLKDGTFADADVKRCMRDVLSNLAFPEPQSGRVSVTYAVKLTTAY